jgi:hypothetical protein
VNGAVLIELATVFAGELVGWSSGCRKRRLFGRGCGLAEATVGRLTRLTPGAGCLLAESYQLIADGCQRAAVRRWV